MKSIDEMIADGCLVPSHGGSRARRVALTMELFDRINRLLALHAPGDMVTGQEAKWLHQFLALPGVPANHPARRLRFEEGA